MSRSKSAIAKPLVPRRPGSTHGNGQANPSLDRLEALEVRLANLERALDTTIRRMAAIQAELDMLSTRRPL